MPSKFDPLKNYEQTKQLVGYLPRTATSETTYVELGFRCGLEIHQQLLTAKKLFCRCPAGLFQKDGEYDAEVVRHMRPTLSELGEYDGTALMEFKTRKNIIYRIKNETACTYDIDDTPPFPLNREALFSAIQIALLLQTSIVGELHITRKQYLDGSIPTGFQRTAIVGIEGKIPLPHKEVRIIQLSVEEDSCREVADVGHDRIYTTDRLGIPLVEIVTYPDLAMPDEAMTAANYLRFLTRSLGKVRTGIGAARQDVNVSIRGGTRVEIKGVAHIRWLPELTHNEAFRQKALLTIQQLLRERIPDSTNWRAESVEIPVALLRKNSPLAQLLTANNFRLEAINLPQFRGILSFFTQPKKCFADELNDRLHIIACLAKVNSTTSEAISPMLSDQEWHAIRERMPGGNDHAQLLFWGAPDDLPTALETVIERCQLAFRGVPNETRKALPDGTTMFERVLPGPNRMYPDTDSAPISIPEELIQLAQQQLPINVAARLQQLNDWKIPAYAYTYILRRNLCPVMEKIIVDFDLPPAFVGSVVGQTLRNLEGKSGSAALFSTDRFYELFAFVQQQKLQWEIVRELLPVIYQSPAMSLDSALAAIGFRRITEEEILAKIPSLRKKFREINISPDDDTTSRWIMGKLRPLAIGNINLNKLKQAIEEISHE